MGKTIITAALTGSWPTKQNNPNIPMTPEEIADAAYECWQKGAAVVHLHMRDESGKPTMRLDLFEKTVNLIRRRCDVILNLTTSGDDNATSDQRQEHLRKLSPEMASYDAGTMNWMHRGLFINHPDFLEELAKTMTVEGVKPEIEVFDLGMIYNALHYRDIGILKSPLHFQICLGAAGGAQATVENLVHMRNLLPKDATWSAFGIGKSSMPILLATLALGGNLRVGMEDNVYYRKGELAKSNGQFVERAVRLIREYGNEAATSGDARVILGIGSKEVVD